MNGMEIQHLRTFVAIAEMANLRKAASVLHLSQSAVSTQLKQLEQRIGLCLFLRSAKGMELTEHGKIILPRARDLLRGMDELQALGQEIARGKEDPLRIGVIGDSAPLRIGRLSRLLQEQFPGRDCFFIASESTQIGGLLREGRIDLGFFYGTIETGGIVSKIISHLPLRIIIPDGLEATGEVDWEELAQLPWILSSEDCPAYNLVLAEMESRNLSPRRVVDAREESIIRDLVLEGQGVGVLREEEAYYLAATGACRVWRDVRFHLPLGLACLQENYRKSPCLEMFELVQKMWQEPESAEAR